MIKVVLEILTLLLILFGLWLVGFSFRLAGGLIHLLLVVIVIIFIFRIIVRTRLRD